MHQHGVADAASSRLASGASCSPRCAPQRSRRSTSSRVKQLTAHEPMSELGRLPDDLLQARVETRFCPENVHATRISSLERLYMWEDDDMDTDWARPILHRLPLFMAPTSPGPCPLARTSLDVWGLPSFFQVSLQDKPKTCVEEKGVDYYANVGYAIRALRDDVPMLFQHDLDYDIYRDDITFKDPLNTFVGIKNYRLIFWSLRFHGKLFFKRLIVDIKRIWQPPSEENVIKMRWTVRGIPRVPWEVEGTFDGISTYRMDRHGKIYEHCVDNVLLRDPPFAVGAPLLMGINLVPLGEQPVAVPGLAPLVTGWLSVSWLRLYVALCATVLLSGCLTDDEAQMAPGQ